MSVTILEALQNADYNIQKNGMIGVKLGKEQLHNGVNLLEKGYTLDTLVEPLLEKHGTVENVPKVIS